MPRTDDEWHPTMHLQWRHIDGELTSTPVLFQKWYRQIGPRQKRFQWRLIETQL